MNSPLAQTLEESVKSLKKVENQLNAIIETLDKTFKPGYIDIEVSKEKLLIKQLVDRIIKESQTCVLKSKIIDKSFTSYYER